MKRTFKTVLIALSLMMMLMSCNNDELFVEETVEVIDDENNEDTEENTEDVKEEEKEVDASLPCDFNLNTVEPNSTIIINCVLDLQGGVVNLPAGVVIEFEGGDITNGTINFGDNNLIDGQLLNSTITIGGSTPQLKDPTFNFDPKRWGIVEGITTSDIALENNRILETIMFKVKEFGVSTFSIDKMDAYFNITTVTSGTTNQNFYPSIEAINIPSNFHLKLSQNTILRVFPTNWAKGGALISFREVSNSKISGGTLYGDRDEHIYSNGYDTKEEGQLLLMVHAANNIEIDGVKMTMGSFGGLNINSLEFTFQPNYKPSHDIYVRNCIFDNNRRMSTSITDGYNIYIENNTYLNAGKDSNYINGGVVGYAINIEAHRDRDSSGELRYYERAEKIFIRNNVERGSRVGGFTVSVGEKVTIEGNDMENKIVYSATSGTKIINNKFVASEKSSKTPAILAAGVGETVFNNEISGNEISGYGVGIAAYTGRLQIFNNILTNNNSGIQLKDMFDTDIFNNKIVSNDPTSRGISLQLTKANNVNIKDNIFNLGKNHLYFVELNQGLGEEIFNVNVKNNSFISEGSSVVFSKTKGVNFENNVVKGPVLLVNASNVSLTMNDITTFDYHGIALSGENKAINIIQNKILFPQNTRFECINITSSTNLNEITDDSNSCN